MTSKEKSALQKEIVDSLDTKPHGRLILAPRIGKTKLIIDIIKRDKIESILWVTPSAKLADEDIPQEFETWKAKKYLKNLTTSTWMSLHKVFGSFDMIVLDEEQFATEHNLQSFFDGSIQCNHIVSMTGTQTKHEDKQDLYKRLDLEILYELSINNAVDIGLLSNYKLNVLEVELGTEKNVLAGSKEKPFMTTEQSQYTYLDKSMKQALFQKRKDAQFKVLARRRFIANANSKFEAVKYLLNSLEGRKLIFCGGIKQAEALSEHTYHSKTDNISLKNFQNGEIDELAMVNTGGTGYTYKAIDHLFVIQCDSDKNGLTSQKICRTLLQQKDYLATIWLVVLKNTQDEVWVASTLENFDQSKVECVNFKSYIKNEKI